MLATFDNGDVICLSADLQVVRWVANLKTIGPSKGSSFDIEHITVATAKSVTRGLLRSREDVAAILNPSSQDTSDLMELTQILCVVGQQSDGSRALRLLQVQPRSQDLTTAPLAPLKHLLSWNLPTTPNTSTPAATVPRYALHPSNGALHALTEGALLAYDFSGTVPRLHSELKLPTSNIDSFLRISQDLLFTTSGHTCRVFDTKFNSLQALLSLDSTPNNSDKASPSKKRKHTQPASSEPAVDAPKLVAYYADIGLVVAVRDDEVFGMQFGETVTRKRAKTEGTLLADALGKGIATKDLQKWQDRKSKLDRYAKQGKIAKFEAALAADLGIELETTDSQTKRENEVTGGPLTNGVGPKLPDVDAMVVDQHDEELSDDLPRKWILPKTIPDSQRQQHRQHALYALSQIFQWVEVDAGQGRRHGALKVDFFPPNVFQWLLQTGNLTKESIRRSKLDEALGDTHPVSSIVDGDIVKALVDFDPELHIVSAILNHSHFLPVGEVVQAIKLLMQSLDDEPSAEATTKLLTNGTTQPDEATDVDITSEIEAASHEIDHALSVLDHGLLIRSHTLRPALIRLHTFPAPLISSTLRSMLPRRDLESLIRLLHLELKNGGWTSPYDFVDAESSPAETQTEDPDDHAVSIVASLLSSTLDAIGAGAWVARSANESSADIIRALYADTQEALNGFWEARFMRGLLSEFLRFSSTLPKSQKPTNKSLKKQNKPFAADEKPDELPMLPLGAKAEMGVEKMKNAKGGRREERSKREMGMLISQRVPKYSLERIVV